MNPHDDRALEALLADSGLDDDPVLADLMAELRDLGNGPAPRPAPAVAALLATGSAPRARRRGRRVVVGLLVAATLGGGAAAAAATPAVRDGASSAVSSFVGATPAPATRDQPVAEQAPSDHARAGRRSTGATPAPAAITVAPAGSPAASGARRAGPVITPSPTSEGHGSGGGKATASPSPRPSDGADDSAATRSSSGKGHGSGKGRSDGDGRSGDSTGSGD
jgi:hypothetical protein